MAKNKDILLVLIRLLSVISNFNFFMMMHIHFHTTFPRLKRSVKTCFYVLIAFSLPVLLSGCEKEEVAAEEAVPEELVLDHEATEQLLARHLAEKLLERRPLAPTNVNLFSPAAYPNATPMVPAAGPAPGEAQVRKMLQAYLKREFPFNPSLQQKGLALFNNPALIAKVPNHSLRAGLIGLLGTAGKPAIDYFLNVKTPAGLPKVATVGFSDQPWDPSNTAIAAVTHLPNGQDVVTFNPRYQSENPFHFTPTFAHEALHTDNLNAGYEEITNKAIESSIYLEQLVRHPELAHTGTELARRNNTNALTRLNSGTGSKLGLFASNGNKPILPGSPLTFTSWFDSMPQAIPPTSPGSPLLVAILQKMAPGATVPANADFSLSTLQFIDKKQRNLTEKELLIAVLALRLTPVFKWHQFK